MTSEALAIGPVPRSIPPPSERVHFQHLSSSKSSGPSQYGSMASFLLPGFAFMLFVANQ